MQASFYKLLQSPVRLLLSFILFITIITLARISSPTHNSSAMSVTHVVLFQFKKSASSDAIRNIEAQMLGLKDTCIHPTSNKAYILSATGGTDHSPEKANRGYTHAFVFEFAGKEDRDYYVDTDPVHDRFKKLAGEVLESAQVLDFTNGIFEGAS